MMFSLLRNIFGSEQRSYGLLNTFDIQDAHFMAAQRAQSPLRLQSQLRNMSPYRPAKPKWDIQTNLSPDKLRFALNILRPIILSPKHQRNFDRSIARLNRDIARNGGKMTVRQKWIEYNLSSKNYMDGNRGSEMALVKCDILSFGKYVLKMWSKSDV